MGSAAERNKKKGQKGFSLVEVLVAMAIMAVIAGAVLSGLATSQKATRLTDIRTQSETIARSQIEYLKAHVDTWYDVSDPPNYDAYILPPPSGYTVSIVAERMDPKQDGYTNDDELQQITVTVSHRGEVILSLTDFLFKP
ncbi:prepilin-type N-terminal cleavage/methylation domain-containing protein [Dehalogenimonas formicexedens]|uniref:Prepilin-type N-terminal cleavage/methylation domain-containing protein n=1 Tax=Dehalogenimonas formicexedens TaxID=1839801 RepID=A0A1P8F820_9CHLR|nr:type II secretion system protein [Dehalogenimonas formicexedens]APV44626.1 prepilin-type N-terminal cleavage/methylation domain-containing protein [Dehalogenimonas formicexedens]